MDVDEVLTITKLKQFLRGKILLGIQRESKKAKQHLPIPSTSHIFRLQLKPNFQSGNTHLQKFLRQNCFD